MTRLWQKSSKQAVIIALLYLAFFGFLFATDPNKLPIGWLLVPFILLFAAIFSTLISIQNRNGGKKQGGSSAKRYATAAILAAIPTFLLLLDSINQLTAGDALIFGIFAIVALFYVRKLSFAART